MIDRIIGTIIRIIIVLDHTVPGEPGLCIDEASRVADHARVEVALIPIAYGVSVPSPTRANQTTSSHYSPSPPHDLKYHTGFEIPEVPRYRQTRQY